MKDWLGRNAKAIQAATGIGTTVIALAALGGVKLQIDASARQQREQSAREIYREFLSLSIAQPKFASPDYCALAGSVDEPGYANYLDYLLYTSEQVLAAQPDWEPVLAEHLSRHKEAICGEGDWGGEAPEVEALIGRFRARECVGFKSACLPDQGVQE